MSTSNNNHVISICIATVALCGCIALGYQSLSQRTDIRQLNDQLHHTQAQLAAYLLEETQTITPSAANTAGDDVMLQLLLTEIRNRPQVIEVSPAPNSINLDDLTIALERIYAAQSNTTQANTGTPVINNDPITILSPDALRKQEQEQAQTNTENTEPPRTTDTNTEPSIRKSENTIVEAIESTPLTDIEDTFKTAWDQQIDAVVYLGEDATGKPVYQSYYITPQLAIGQVSWQDWYLNCKPDIDLRQKELAQSRESSVEKVIQLPSA